jgi:uncharacterized protein (DUF1330 family)
MTVYMIIESTIMDPERYRAYTEKVPGIVARFGGRYLARGQGVTALSGNWQPERVILLEFPAEQNVFDWLASPEYKAVAPLREAGAKTRAILVEGSVD